MVDSKNIGPFKIMPDDQVSSTEAQRRDGWLSTVLKKAPKAKIKDGVRKPSIDHSPEAIKRQLAGLD